jgi:hypothetical protein
MGVPLIVRTLTLRVGNHPAHLRRHGLGTASVRAHQVAFTLWSFLALALDAIAIAAQALTGRSLGAGDVAGTRAITRRMMWWGLFSGMIGGLALWGLRDLYVPVVHQRSGGTTYSRRRTDRRRTLATGERGRVRPGRRTHRAGDGRISRWPAFIALVLYVPLALCVLWLEAASSRCGGRSVGTCCCGCSP